MHAYFADNAVLLLRCPSSVLRLLLPASGRDGRDQPYLRLSRYFLTYGLQWKRSSFGGIVNNAVQKGNAQRLEPDWLTAAPSSVARRRWRNQDDSLRSKPIQNSAVSCRVRVLSIAFHEAFWCSYKQLLWKRQAASFVISNNFHRVILKLTLSRHTPSTSYSNTIGLHSSSVGGAIFERRLLSGYLTQTPTTVAPLVYSSKLI